MSLLPVKLNLSKLQARKLVNQKTVQLKPEQFIAGGNYEVMVDKQTYNKIKRASRLNKGVRLTLSNDQIAATMTGEGFKSFIRKSVKGLKSIGKKVKEDVIKPTAKKLKQMAKDEAKAFVIESLGQEKPVEMFRAGAKERAGKFLREQALPEVRRATKEGITLSEKELENKLIEEGMPEDLTRAIVTAGSYRLDNATAQELDNLDTQLQGMGIIKGVHYTRRGGKINFKKIWRSIKRTGRKALNFLEPVLQPLLSTGAAALGSVAGPLGSLAASKTSDAIYDKLQGEGMRKRKSLKGTPAMAEKMAKLRAMKKQGGGSLYPMGGKRGGALYPMGGKQRGRGVPKPKSTIVKPKSEVTKQSLYVEGGYETNPMSYTGQFLI
jgi:hypothetical protein